ncbi:hypothetical protein B0H10DRAFT_1529 [Mycena sp. CBHHK59/15]|nr:hypothetical protein B0H10DRAFT_1529 [Mycena sp. CBHHK59/15]
MVFLASTLFAACVLPSVMGLTLNTPAGAVEDGTVAVTWTTVATDPKFSLLLVSPTEAFDVAQGIDPTTLSDTVALGNIPPGSGYTLQAVVADDINTVLSTSGAFTVSPAGTAANAGAAAGAAGAATGAATTGTAAAAKTGKGTKGAKGAAAAAAGAGAAKAAAAKAATAKAAAAKAAKGKGFRQGGRSVASAKFGRRELYRE